MSQVGGVWAGRVWNGGHFCFCCCFEGRGCWETSPGCYRHHVISPSFVFGNEYSTRGDSCIYCCVGRFYTSWKAFVVLGGEGRLRVPKSVPSSLPHEIHVTFFVFSIAGLKA